MMSVLLEIAAGFLIFVFLITILCAIGSAIDDKDYTQCKVLTAYAILILLFIAGLAYLSYIIR